ncbi:MAG: response regulator [Pseudomonadota bacterium]|nr:response regulator [Pseudomonadota bacterium]
MNPRPGPRLYRALPMRVAAGILGMVTLLVGWQISWVQRNELREVERAGVEQVVRDMTLLHATLEFALAAGAVEQVDRELTARGSDTSVDALVLVDDAGRVVGSRLRHQVGLPMEEVLGEPLPDDMMDAARDRQVGSARLSPDRRRVLATYPVVLGMKPGQLRADRVGVVIAVYSLDRARADVQHRLLRRASELVVVALIAAAALLLFGQVFIGRRVRMLVSATERLAAGDFDTRAGIPGADELALLGSAFDSMTARIGETQRRVAESEVRFRTLVEAAPVGIFRTDDTARVIESNAAWRGMAGENGGAWPDAIHPDDRERVLTEWDLAVGAGRMARAECRLVRPDGGVVWVQIQGVQERAVLPGPAGLINTAVDLTERRLAEQTRASLEARLQQAQKLEALGTLASGVAHDFNNVLAAVLGNAEILARAVGGQPVAERHVRGVLEAAERGRGMVRQILEYGRPGLRDLREVPIAQLVEEVARLLRPMLPENVELRLAVAPDLPTILADPDQLHRVLVNLGTNAWQSMRPRGGVLEIGARGLAVDDEEARHVPGLRPGPAVLLWVRDEGCGMNAATQARLFEPFFSTKPAGEGTGLGLAVVRGIVQAHGGAIVVESEPAKGTQFSVYLPTADGTGTGPSPAPGAPSPVAAPASPPHILYVDDDDALVELAEHAFRRLGYRVSAFSSPKDALAAFRDDPSGFDLVVTDQRMPELMGEELVSALLEIRADVPIVLMSGQVTPDDVARIRALGARAVVEKPMTGQELVALCHRVLSDAGTS